MKRLLSIAGLALAVSLVAAGGAPAAEGQQENGADMCACWDPPPPPPPPPPEPPPPPPPPPPDGEPWSPDIAPGEGYGDWHATPNDGWQLYGSRCWARELMRSRGSGPWTRRLFLYTVWCGRSGKITYRSSSVRTHHDSLCWNTSGPYQTRTYGGANYPLVEVQAWVPVACAAIPTGWPNYNDTLMLRVQYFPNGVYRTVAWN